MSAFSTGINKVINGWDALKAAKFWNHPRYLQAKAVAKDLAIGTKVNALKYGGDVAARAGMYPARFGAYGNIAMGAAGGAALGAGYGYYSNRDMGRSAMTGAMYGAGAGLGYNLFRGARSSFRGGAIGKGIQSVRDRANTYMGAERLLAQAQRPRLMLPAVASPSRGIGGGIMLGG